MDWLDRFLVSFGKNVKAGPETGDGQYLYRDQRDVSRDYDQKMFDAKKVEERDANSNDLEEKVEIGRSDDTGEKFEVKVQTLNPKDKKEMEWVEREMVVTFTSLDDREKVITSTLTRLCNGKYASFKSLPVSEVAEQLSRKCDEVFNFAEASVAIYSDVIDPKHAFRIARSISEKNIISYLDYEKIKQKLPGTLENDFDNLLAEAHIKVSYPINSKNINS